VWTREREKEREGEGKTRSQERKWGGRGRQVGGGRETGAKSPL